MVDETVVYGTRGGGGPSSFSGNIPGNNIASGRPTDSLGNTFNDMLIAGEMHDKKYGGLKPEDIKEMLDLENLNPEASYRGQNLDNIINTGKQFGKDLYNTAAKTSTGIGNIPIAGVAYKNAIANANPGAFLAGKVLAPNVMSDFGFAEGGPVNDRIARDRRIPSDLEIEMLMNKRDRGEDLTEEEFLILRGIPRRPGRPPEPYREPLPEPRRPKRMDDVRRPSLIPGFQDGGMIDRIALAVQELMKEGYSEEEARQQVQKLIEAKNKQDQDFITDDGLDLREADGTSLNNFDEMNYKANGGQVRRRVPDMYFGRYNMGGAVAPGQMSKPVGKPAGNPMLTQIANTDPRYYSPPPNPMGNLAGGISNLANNQKKTNKLLGGNNQNNNAVNQNLKISYNPNPTNMEQRRVFSNVLESTRPVMT